MTRPEFKRPPEEIDMAVEEHAIRRDTNIALVVTLAAFFGAYHYLPGLMEFPEQRAEALAMAALAWAVPAFVLMVAILMVSTGRRFSAADKAGRRRVRRARSWP